MVSFTFSDLFPNPFQCCSSNDSTSEEQIEIEWTDEMLQNEFALPDLGLDGMATPRFVTPRQGNIMRMAILPVMDFYPVL